MWGRGVGGFVPATIPVQLSFLPPPLISHFCCFTERKNKHMFVAAHGLGRTINVYFDQQFQRKIAKEVYFISMFCPTRLRYPYFFFSPTVSLWNLACSVSRIEQEAMMKADLWAK